MVQIYLVSHTVFIVFLFPINETLLINKIRQKVEIDSQNIEDKVALIFDVV